jgi:hypothetical protein
VGFKMKIAISASYAVTLLAAGAVLAGCDSGALRTMGQPGGDTSASFGMSPAAVKSPVQHPDQHSSWVSPDVNKARELLFASDPASDDVYIYTLPSLKLEGTLTGFTSPQGECNDGAGNVWVVTQGASPEIIKLSRAGKIVGTLADSTGYPASCAIDRSTGNLGVTNIAGFNSTAGDVLIYAHAKGKPAIVSDPSIYEYYFAGYDSKGNLFADGLTQTDSFVLSECAAGCVGATMTTISISGGEVHWPGFVQWYPPGGYLAVGDQGCNDLAESCIDDVQISGSSGTITGTTKLENPKGNPVCDLVEGVIDPDGHKNVLGGDDETGRCGGVTTEDNWQYPAGGSPTYFNSGTQISEPIGAAISIK